MINIIALRAILKPPPSQPRKNGSYLFHVNRLREEKIHSAGESLLLCGNIAQTRYGDDGGSAGAAEVFEAANGARGFEAVHDRHVDVHENDVGFDGQLVVIDV